MTRRAFTLIELLVVVALIAVLIGTLLPALARSRESARVAGCASNQRQLITAWNLYANEHAERAMPLANINAGSAGVSALTYWWGSVPGGGLPVDPAQGFIGPYLDSALAARSVLECPSQPWGTYRAQPSVLKPAQPTSTYGYNGYYLCPEKTPGWSDYIAQRPWRRVGDIPSPERLFVFADAMLPGARIANSALLDPPLLYYPGSQWQRNQSPTTAFRHHARRGNPGLVSVARADGSAGTSTPNPGWMVGSTFIGSSVDDLAPHANAAHYVPDALDW